jgi:hypothetical protein
LANYLTGHTPRDALVESEAAVSRIDTASRDSGGIADISSRTAARVAGFALIAITVLAIFANFFVLESLVVAGDAAETASRIAESPATFRAGVVAWVLIGILDLVAALMLYVVFRPVNRSISLLAGWFRLVYTAVFIAGMSHFLAALRLLGDAEHVGAFDAAQQQSQVMQSLDAFQDTWTIALVVIGVHLGLLGYLAYRSGFVPKWLGILLFAASASYILDNLAKIAFADYGGPVTLAVSAALAMGELVLAVWLVVRSKAVPETTAA